MKRFIILFLLIILALFQINAQRLTFTQINKDFSKLKVPENKSILIFQSDLDLSFTSSMEKLDSPIKKENFYYLTVSERVCIIKVINNVSKSEVELPFGQLSEKTLPIIKKGEYLIFKIEENNKELIVFNQTEIKKGEGLNDNQMLYDKEALLILNVDPFDLEIELESTQPITAIKHSGKQYKVYIKPIKQEIKVIQKGSDVQGVINIIHIEPKEVQYFYVSLPEHLRKREIIYDKNISVGDYLIESVPSGAVIEIFGNPSFNAEKNKTPYLLKGFETGFKVVTLTLPEYETIKDTIQIGSSKKNKSSYNLVPQFAFINIKVEPQFPYSSLYVDNQIFYAKNETDIKIPVSSKEVEIRAQHFESEIFKINPSPGEVLAITKKMKPILGKLFLECGENAEKGKVYLSYSKLNIEKKLIGTLPIKDTLILQEGQYDLIVEKEGYAMFKKPIQIEKNKIINEIVALGLTKKVLIITEPDNAAIYIDGNYVGKSNKKLNLSIGSHEIILVKEGYENHYKKINITSFVDSIRIELKINQILLALSFQNKSAGNPPLPMPKKTPIFSINNSFFTKMNINSKGSIVYSPNYIALTPNIEQKITVFRRDYYYSTKDDYFIFFPINFKQRTDYFISGASISYKLNRINEGLILDKTKEIYSNDIIDNECIELKIKNNTNNSLSFYSNMRIVKYYKENEIYILHLKKKNQKLTVLENNTPYSSFYWIEPVEDDRKNYIELNVKRNNVVSNITVFVDNGSNNVLQTYENDTNRICKLLMVNQSLRKLGFNIEGKDNNYKNYIIVDKVGYTIIYIPSGTYQYTIDDADIPENGIFTINKENFFRFYNGSNGFPFKGYKIANACISNNYVNNIQITYKNAFEFSKWSGYLFYKDEKVNCEIEIENNNAKIDIDLPSGSKYWNCNMNSIYDIDSKTLKFIPINVSSNLNFTIQGKFRKDTLFEGEIDNTLFGKIFLKRDTVFYSNYLNNNISKKINQRVYAKISMAEGTATIYVNGIRAVLSEWGDVHPAYSGNSGWIDISSYLSMGVNEIKFYVWNSKDCCNTSANFQIRSKGEIVINEFFQKGRSTAGLQYEKTIELLISD